MNRNILKLLLLSLFTFACLGQQEINMQMSATEIARALISNQYTILDGALNKTLNTVESFTDELKDAIKKELIRQNNHIFHWQNDYINFKLRKKISSMVLGTNHLYQFALVAYENENHADLLCLSTTLFQKKSLVGHSNSINSIAVTPDGKYALTSSWDRTARLWDLTQSPITHKIVERVEQQDITCVALSPDGKFALIASCTEGLTNENIPARLWNLTDNPTIIRKLEGPQDLIFLASLSSNGHYAVTSSKDKPAIAWDLTANPVNHAILQGHESGIHSIALTENAKLAVVAANNNSLNSWQLKEEPIGAAQVDNFLEGPIGSYAMSTDGAYSLIRFERGTVLFIDHALKMFGAFEENNESVCAISLSPDGKSALISYKDGSFRFLRLKLLSKKMSIRELYFIIKQQQFKLIEHGLLKADESIDKLH